MLDVYRLAAKGSPASVEKAMTKWARDAEINLTLED